MTEERKANEDVFRRARELEGRFWHSLSRANRPDVFRADDGSAGLEATQRELVDFLRAHRSELESAPHWQAYIEDLDRVRLLEPPGDADPAEQRRVEREEWTRGSSADSPVTPPANRPAPGRRP